MVWPACHFGSDKDIITILEKYGQVVYQKNLEFKNGAGKRFLYTVPEKKRTVEKHYFNYFPRGIAPKLRVFLWEGTVEDVTKAKKEVRYHYNLYPWAMHVNDFHHQTIEAAEIFFNNNSLHFYNYSKRKMPPKARQLFNRFKRARLQSRINKDLFCIDGSAVLALYGIRDVNVDFDFLYHGDQSKLPKSLKKWPIDPHNQVWVKLNFNIDDIIFNPKNHFYFEGMKWVALDVMTTFKKRQKRKRDLQDVNLIKHHINSMR